jgi:DNA-binding MarR family transcriptional regulator
MSAPDEIIHQSLRLKIMATLHAEYGEGAMEFTRLRGLLKATDGNLGSHLSTLEKAGYVTIDKDFVGKKPRTRVAITPDGVSAFKGHVAYLREVLDGA